MSTDLILDLDANEFLDNVDDQKIDAGTLWQDEATDQLIYFLSTGLEEARAYKSYRNNLKSTYLPVRSAHNSILVAGPRGSGKSVFINNVKVVWRNKAMAEVQDKIAFLKPIDPTMLYDADRFSNVIVAQLYNKVAKKLTSTTSTQESQNQTFYKTLKLLSDALDNNTEDLHGIDHIIKYRSGVDIERLFHEFIEACLSLLDCDAIAICIDDVDMAIDNAYEVLDDIRKLLGCPYILPIVSGDLDLYEDIVYKEFLEKITKNRNLRESSDKGRARKLADAYITKVFPTHLRLVLQDVNTLMSRLKIIRSKDSQIEGIKFNSYEKQLIDFFYSYCNGEEKSTDWPKPKNARETNQVVRQLPPHQEVKSWQTFEAWALQQQDGVAYTNAISKLTLEQFRTSSIQHKVVANNWAAFNILDLIAFNPKSQALVQSEQRLNWANKDFYSFNNKTDMPRGGKLLLNSAFANNRYVLRGMPAIEWYPGELYISKESIRQSIEQTVEAKLKDPDPFTPLKNKLLLLKLYTHQDYYGDQQSRYNLIFFSRAFEIIAFSLLAANGELDGQSRTDDWWQFQIDKMMNRTPFYSLFAMSQTKAIKDEVDKDASENETEYDFRSKYGNEIRVKVSEFAEDIQEWVTNTQLDGSYSLLPLLTLVFNKTFNQLALFYQNNKAESNEHLSDAAFRFEYMFINALTSFTVPGRVVQANTAITKTLEVLRDPKKFFHSEQTISKNIEGLLHPTDVEPITGVRRLIVEENDPSYPIAYLIQNIWNHPILKLNHGIGLDSDQSVFKIGKIRQRFVPIKIRIADSELNNLNTSFEILELIKEKIRQDLGQSKVTTAAVERWLEKHPTKVTRLQRELAQLTSEKTLILNVYKPNEAEAIILRIFKVFS